MDLDEYSRFACRLADAARVETLGRARDAGQCLNKGGANYDPVTEADVAAERAMRALIRETYPEHGVMGEELPDQPSACDLSWSLDPIDGTRSFVCGLPTWTTLIAMLSDGDPVLGVIDAPRLDERYVGRGGTWLGAQRLRTSTCGRLEDARLSSTDPGLFAGADAAAFERVRAAAQVVRYGHDGYAYARLAAGSIDLVVEAGLKPYDMMALVPVVRGAGGTIGSWQGGDDIAGGNIVAAATYALFAQVVERLNA